MRAFAPGSSAASGPRLGVACLLAFTIFVAAQLAPFIQISVEQYRIAEDTPVILQWVQLAVKGIAFTSQWLLGAFGATKPVDALVDGRSIGLAALVQSAKIATTHSSCSSFTTQCESPSRSTNS